LNNPRSPAGANSLLNGGITGDERFHVEVADKSFTSKIKHLTPPLRPCTSLRKHGAAAVRHNPNRELCHRKSLWPDILEHSLTSGRGRVAIAAELTRGPGHSVEKVFARLEAKYAVLAAGQNTEHRCA